MRFIRPIDVTPDTLISTNVPENDYPAWSATTAYAIGTRVMLNHRNYEAVVAHTNRNPATDTVIPLAWLDLGATNRWRMFDEKVGTQTIQTGGVTVTLKPGSVINALALINVAGESVDITMTDPIEGVVFNRHISLIDAAVDNWYDWFFEDIDMRTSTVLLDMPAYGTANVTISINSVGSAAVGALIIGKLSLIGTALYGTSVGIDDYSRKERDAFGNLVVTERAYSDNADFPVNLQTSRVAKVKRMLAEIRARPVVWIGEETYEATIIYGFFKSFSEIISGPESSDMQLTIEGLT